MKLQFLQIVFKTEPVNKKIKKIKNKKKLNHHTLSTSHTYGYVFSN